MAQRLLSQRFVDGIDLGRLVLQVVGVIVTTIAIWMLVPLVESGDDRSTGDRSDRVI